MVEGVVERGGGFVVVEGDVGISGWGGFVCGVCWGEWM